MTLSNPILSDGRLKLKELTVEDISDEYIGWLNNPETNRYLEVRHQTQTRASVSAYVQRILNSHTGYLFAIYLDDIHVGNIQLILGEHYQVGSIGLLIGHKSYTGQGVGTDAIKLVTEFATKQLKLKKLEAGCYEKNLGSLSCFLKCGYAVEGFIQSSVEVAGERMGVFKIGKVLT